MTGPLVLHVLPEDVARGAQVQMRELVAGLDGRGARHEMVLLFGSERSVTEARHLLGVAGRGRRRGFSPLAALRLRRLVRRLRPVAVVAHGSEPLKYAAVAKGSAPLVYQRIGEGAALTGPSRWLYRLLGRRVHEVVAVSDEAAAAAVRWLGIGSDHCSVIPNGRDPERFRPAEPGSRPNGAVRLVWVGHLDDDKRPEVFVEVVRRVRARGHAVEAFAVGDGPRLEELKGMEPSVAFLGRRSDVDVLLRDADVLVFTSASADEGLPGVLVEAALTGLPIVTTAVAGARTVVAAGRSGFVRPIGDIDGIVDDVASLVADADLRGSMGAEARRLSARLTTQAMLEGWERCLAPLVHGTVRVLFVIESLGQGGAERSLVGLLPALAADGIDADVAIFHEREGYADEARAAGATLHTVAAPTRLGRLLGLARLVRRLHPDLVHTSLVESDVLGRLAARLGRRPVVSSLVSETYGPEHAADPGVRLGRMRAWQAIDALTAHLTVSLHAVSQQVATVMGPRLRMRPDRFVVIPRGRDGDALGRWSVERAAGERRRLGWEPSAQYVLGIGRHEHPKGFETLLRAMPAVLEAHPRVHLVIAGREGSATEGLRNLVVDLGLDSRVSLLGARDDVAGLLCACDVLAFPSVREGLPGTLIEAIALETPIVASDIGPNLEVAGGLPRVVFVAPGDERALASAVIDQLATARSLEPAMRSRFEDRYESEAVGREFASWLRSAAAPLRS